MKLSVIIQRENHGYVSLCPELDIASQGDMDEDAKENLREALDLFFEYAPLKETQQRMSREIYVSQVAVGATHLAYQI